MPGNSQPLPFAAILEKIPDGVIITGETGHIAAWLGAAERIFGYAAAEVRGRHITSLLEGSPGEFVPGDEFAAGIPGRHKDGSRLTIRLVNREKIPEGDLWICRDVTSLKKVAQIMNTFHDEIHAELEKMVEEKTSALKRLNEELEQRVKLRTREVEKIRRQTIEQAHRAGMAELAIRNLHNIGNILNNITTGIYFLNRNIEDAALQRFQRANNLLKEKLCHMQDRLPGYKYWHSLVDYYRLIAASLKKKNQLLRDTCRHLDSKVEEINDIISSQNSGRDIPVFTGAVNVTALLESNLARQARAMHAAGIEVIKGYDDIPYLYTNKLKLDYILSCLLDSAIGSMLTSDRGNRILSLNLKQEPDSFVLRIGDTGRGIEPTELKRIFNQGYSARKGLYHPDLHNCANYVQEMNGTITAESEGPDRGSVFILRFYHTNNRPAERRVLCRKKPV